MVGSNPDAKVSNVLTVQRDGLSTELVELVRSQNKFAGIDSRRKDSKLGLRAHLKIGLTRRVCSWRNRSGGLGGHDKGGSAHGATSRGSCHKGSGGCHQKDGKEAQSKEGIHG